jgi:ketosteroid isomerase-like protein
MGRFWSHAEALLVRKHEVRLGHDLRATIGCSIRLPVALRRQIGAKVMSPASNDDVVEIAKKVYGAFVTKDRAAIESLIADDFHFTSPLDNRIDRKTYFARCWPNSEGTLGFEFIHLVANGNRVFVTYEGRAAGDRAFRNSEVLTIRAGQVVEVEVYFGWSLPHEAPLGGFVDERANRPKR